MVGVLKNEPHTIKGKLSVIGEPHNGFVDLLRWMSNLDLLWSFFWPILLVKVVKPYGPPLRFGFVGAALPAPEGHHTVPFGTFVGGGPSRYLRSSFSWFHRGRRTGRTPRALPFLGFSFSWYQRGRRTGRTPRAPYGSSLRSDFPSGRPFPLPSVILFLKYSPNVKSLTSLPSSWKLSQSHCTVFLLL